MRGECTVCVYIYFIYPKMPDKQSVLILNTKQCVPLSPDIMKLKKLPTRMAGKAREKKGEAFISRHAGGLCFDFHSRDFNV